MTCKFLEELFIQRTYFQNHSEIRRCPIKSDSCVIVEVYERIGLAIIHEFKWKVACELSGEACGYLVP